MGVYEYDIFKRDGSRSIRAVRELNKLFNPILKLIIQNSFLNRFNTFILKIRNKSDSFINRISLDRVIDNNVVKFRAVYFRVQ